MRQPDQHRLYNSSALCRKHAHTDERRNGKTQMLLSVQTVIVVAVQGAFAV